MTRVVDGKEIVADNMVDLFDWRLRLTPNAIFARFEGESVTYAELDERISHIVAGLEAERLAKGDRVATFMHNSLVHLAVMFACARKGVLWAPMNVALKQDEVLHSLEELDPKKIFVDSELSPTLVAGSGHSWAKRAIVVGGANELLAFDDWVPEGRSNVRESVRAGDPFCVMYSGGTTGRPKGVVLPHFCAVSCGFRMLDVAEFGSEEVFYSSSHLYHALLPCAIIPLCMLKGYTVCFSRWWSASRFLDRVRKYQATVVDPFIGMVATLLKTPESKDDAASSARIAISGFGGSEPRSLELRQQFEKRFGIRTYQPYGQTEAGGFVTTETESDKDKRGSSGKLRGWYDLQIVDEDGLELSANSVGEIIVRPNVPGIMALGYLGRAEETIRNWRDLWIHTGDEGYLDSDGFLYFVGRKGHFLRRRGELVSVAEVEEAVLSSSVVSEAIVIPVPSDMGEDDILCAVVWNVDCENHHEQLIAYCREKLAAFKVPQYVRTLAEVPRTAAKGEVDRPALRRLGTEGCWKADTR